MTTPKTPKKAIAGSATYALEAMKNAASPLPEIPAHVKVRPQDRPFVESILRARTRDEWIDSDIVIAVQLARAQADIEVESEALDAEGTVIRNDRGTQVMNPRVSVLEQLARREMALMRTLRIGGSAVPGAPKRIDLDRKRRVQQNSERIRADLAEEDLLA